MRNILRWCEFGLVVVGKNTMEVRLVINHFHGFFSLNQPAIGRPQFRKRPGNWEILMRFGWFEVDLWVFGKSTSGKSKGNIGHELWCFVDPFWPLRADPRKGNWLSEMCGFFSGEVDDHQVKYEFNQFKSMHLTLRSADGRYFCWGELPLHAPTSWRDMGRIYCPSSTVLVAGTRSK